MSVDVNNIMQQVLSPEFQDKIFFVKIGFLAIAVFFFVMVIYTTLRTQYMQFAFIEDLVEFFTFRPFGINKFAKQWTKLIKRLEKGTEFELKLSIIEADQMLDETLDKMGYKGETSAEKVKAAPSTILPNADRILQVHKVRNDIVYDPDYKVPLDEAKKILAVYEQAFRDLQLF